MVMLEEIEYEFDEDPKGSCYGLRQNEPPMTPEEREAMRKYRIERGWKPPED
jgi:hypothetical protein